MPGLPPFLNGAIGYFGYGLGRLLERLPATAVDESMVELDVGFYDWVLAADHLAGEN
jgi:para-aminobenzoate synthetase component 1